MYIVQEKNANLDMYSVILSYTICTFHIQGGNVQEKFRLPKANFNTVFNRAFAVRQSVSSNRIHIIKNQEVYSEKIVY